MLVEAVQLRGRSLLSQRHLDSGVSHESDVPSLQNIFLDTEQTLMIELPSFSKKPKIPSNCKGPRKYAGPHKEKLVCSGHGVCVGFDEYQEDKKAKTYCDCSASPSNPEGGWMGPKCELRMTTVRVDFPCAAMPPMYIAKARETIELMCPSYSLVWQVVFVLFLCFSCLVFLLSFVNRCVHL